MSRPREIEGEGQERKSPPCIVYAYLRTLCMRQKATYVRVTPPARGPAAAAAAAGDHGRSRTVSRGSSNNSGVAVGSRQHVPQDAAEAVHQQQPRAWDNAPAGTCT